MAKAIERRLAALADLTDLPDHDFKMPRDSEFDMRRNDKAMKIGQGLIIGDGIDPVLAVFPRCD